MNILFYTISNKRSRDIESQAMAFSREGNSIFLLTQSGHSELHDFFISHQFIAVADPTPKTWFPIYLVTQIIKLIRFCWIHKITIVHSHLDPCNQVAVYSQYFIPAIVIVTRHHADALQYETSPQGQRASQRIYQLARKIIAVSANVKDFMVTREGIRPGKIAVIPLSFDFALFPLPDKKNVELIKRRYNSRITLVTVGRLTPLKRIHLIIDLVDQLSKRGLDVKLLIVGQGEEETRLKNLTAGLNLVDQIHFVGFVHNVQDYLAAADFYVHFSISEASCNTVKEASLVETPVIVCHGVGDFNSYIRDNINGFLVDHNNPVSEAAVIISEYWQDKGHLEKIGRNLNETVRHHFDINNVLNLYRQLHSEN